MRGGQLRRRDAARNQAKRRRSAAKAHLLRQFPCVVVAQLAGQGPHRYLMIQRTTGWVFSLFVHEWLKRGWQSVRSSGLRDEDRSAADGAPLALTWSVRPMGEISRVRWCAQG